MENEVVKENIIQVFMDPINPEAKTPAEIFTNMCHTVLNRYREDVQAGRITELDFIRQIGHIRGLQIAFNYAKKHKPVLLHDVMMQMRMIAKPHEVLELPED